jgi:short-subunit dehydrogenase
MKLKGSRILVTGAPGGIGSALCRLLATGGARLVLNSRNEMDLRNLAAQLPGNHAVVAADIGTGEGRAAIADACYAEGGIDVLVNLAGMLEFGLFTEQTQAAIERLLTVNVFGPLLLTRELLPHLLERAEARIVNVGSIYGSIGHPGFVAYCSSKAALKTFSEALGRELADTRVSVAYVAPRATATNLNPESLIRLQEVLGNECDSPQRVAAEILGVVVGTAKERMLGWPEKLFVRVNALLPALVHAALVKKLPVIKAHAKNLRR